MYTRFDYNSIEDLMTIKHPWITSTATAQLTLVDADIYPTGLKLSVHPFITNQRHVHVYNHTT